MAAIDGDRRELMTAQLGIWYAQQLNPGDPVYNMGGYLDIRGDLDVDLFELALRGTMAEAEAAHLRFEATAGRPRQHLARSGDWPLPVIDLSAAADPRAAAAAWMRADMHRPADLASGPLFTMALLRMAPDRFWWYQRGHHIALDAYSGSIIAARQAQVYTALTAGADPAAGALAPFTALLDADAAYRASAAFGRDRDFWAGVLAGRPEVTSLSGQRMRAPRRFPDRYAEPLGPAAAARLRAAARDLKTSVAGLMVTAAAVFQHRGTGAGDVVLGLPVLGRAGHRARGIPGMTANVLPVRLAVTPDTTVSGLLAQTSASLREAFAHQRYRLEDMRRDLKLTDGTPLFGTLVNVMPFDYRLQFGDCPATAHSLASGPVGDLRVSVFDGAADGTMQFGLDVNPDLYGEQAGREMARGFLDVLDWVISAPPETPVRLASLTPSSPAPAASAAAPASAASAAAPASAVAPSARTLPDLVAARAADTPAAVAVTDGDTRLTYRELNEAASRLARLLRSRGAGPETSVAVLMERSAGLVVTMLAVQKTGAAYLPMDPGYPAERIVLTLRDASPVLVVTDRATAASGPALGAGPVLVADGPEVLADLAGRDGTDLTNTERGGPLRPAQPAYVIYTSGSTGTPKGVAVSHASVCALLAGTRERFGFGPDDVWAWFHSAAFDFSVWEIWGCLASGGRLVVVPHPVSRAPAEFLGLLIRERVTVLNQNPVGVLPADPGRRGRRRQRRATGPAGRGVRRRGAGCHPAGAVAGPARRDPGSRQHVRDHRDHGARHLSGARPVNRGPGQSVRPSCHRRKPGGRPDPRAARVRAGPVPAAGAGRGGRRALRGRGRPGPRLPGPGRPDQRPVRGLPVRGFRRADVPDR